MHVFSVKKCALKAKQKMMKKKEMEPKQHATSAALRESVAKRMLLLLRDEGVSPTRQEVKVCWRTRMCCTFLILGSLVIIKMLPKKCHKLVSCH